ncbi:MAG TPA: ankyrin repeat domain-containing protein [Gemmatimonadales bacterium]|nr:ankyrin repeat domain-containing protein [Gemmatimonadales bacterium]
MNTRTEFLEAAIWHGNLERAKAILAAHPELESSDIHTAAVLGDAAAVRRFLAQDPRSVAAKSPPFGGDALNYLCLSKYLRLDPSRTPGFLQAATALLDAGADPNTGFWNKGEFETALYGAAGVAHHPELTRLLLERGADPTDGEVVYHSPEEYDSRAMQLVVETGKLSPDDLSLMLVRKSDWHDYEGAKWLLEHGADINFNRKRGWCPIHHALARDNSLEMVALFLDHGADPTLVEDGITAIARAAREGRSDVLELFAQRGIPIALTGVDRLIAACAMGDVASARAIAEKEPALVRELKAMGGQLLAKFSGTGNPPGVEALLDLGVDVAAPFTEGDGYYGLPKNSLAIHVAAWRCSSAVVKLLLDRGAPADLPDANGMTPLALAVKACVDSYWTEYCSPESVEMLLQAGANVAAVPFPSGHGAVDQVLLKYRS